MQYYYVGQAFAISSAVVQVMVLILCRDVILSSYVTDHDIGEEARYSWPTLLYFILLNGTQIMGLPFI